jgi:hypothetical protein
LFEELLQGLKPLSSLSLSVAAEAATPKENLLGLSRRALRGVKLGMLLRRVRYTSWRWIKTKYLGR